MTRFQIFRQLRRNNMLSYRRSPAFEQSMVAKVMMALGAGIMAIYLIIFAISFAVLSNEEAEPAVIMMLLPFLLLVDFALRFMVQQTPAMLLKPYMLLPMPRRSVVDTFLVTSVLSGYNSTWLFLFLPYAYITVSGEATVAQALAVLFSGMLLIMANSQWYLLVRTLISRSLLWWLLPIAFYGLLLLPLFLLGDEPAFDPIIDSILAFCTTWFFTLFCVALLLLLLYVNRGMQYRFAYEEVAREEKPTVAMKTVTKLSFLDRFGLMGEYLKLEMKSNMRNKAIRSRMFMSIGLIVMFSLLIAYTDIYDNAIMENFWCYYCFAIYGMTTLVKIMGPEGNYIDLLMVHKENILSLLKAKYYFHVLILFIPFLIMLPAVIEGKFSMLMMFAYLLLSSGILFFTLFQLAVYNKQTLPLEQKLTGKGNVENGLQLIIELLAMFIPLVLVGCLLAFFDETTSYLVMIAVGLAFTLLHPFWLRNIYTRMMVRKYKNLEGFHATR